MPAIDHVALYVSDLEEVCAFYTTFFDASLDEGYHNPRTGLRTHFLTFDDGARLEVMTRPGHDVAPDAMRRGFIHVAFSMGSRDAVDALVRRFEQAGVPLVDGPRVTGDGYYEAVVHDPEGNAVEVVA